MKLSRHTKILDLIAKYSIDTQEELARRLADSGYNVTQATVSRDIKDLKLVKVLGDDGVYKYVQSGGRETNSADKNFNSILVNSVINIEFAMNIVVIKTHSGMAQAVGFDQGLALSQHQGEEEHHRHAYRGQGHPRRVALEPGDGVGQHDLVGVAHMGLGRSVGNGRGDVILSFVHSILP